MDNPKQSNRGKFMRSKHKKESHKKPKNYGSEDRTIRSSKPKDNDNLERQDPNQSTSAVKTKTVTENSQAEEPQKVDFSHLKRETEELNDYNRKYQRRAIVSNWTKDYNIPEINESDDEDGFDFKELLTGSSSYYVGSHFLMKEEQEWLKHSESCDSPFSIDLKNLEAGISSIPFYKRHDLLEKSFSPKEIQNMNGVAENNELLYKDMKTAKSKTQKIQLSSRVKETDIANKIMGIITNTNIENKNSQCDISNNINCDTNIEKDEQKTSRDISVKNYDDNDIILNHEIDLTLPKSNTGNDENILSVTPPPASLEQRKQNRVLLEQHKPVKKINTGDKNQFEISNENDNTNNSEEIEKFNVDSIKTTNSLSNIKDFNNSEQNFQTDSVKLIKINESADKNILMNNKTEVKTVPEVEIEESLKVSEKKQSSNIDDELDFLLGLKQPTIVVDSNNASNLTILQEKLKDKHTDKKQINESVVKQPPVNNTDEDLDEWLNSVLES